MTLDVALDAYGDPDLDWLLPGSLPLPEFDILEVRRGSGPPTPPKTIRKPSDALTLLDDTALFEARLLGTALLETI